MINDRVKPTLAILGNGEMGAGMAAALHRNGFHVLTDLSDRGDDSRKRAMAAGMADAGNLGSMLAAADIVLSIVPPDAAPGVSAQVFAGLQTLDKIPAPLFVDCNAVAPETVKKMAASYLEAGFGFVDGSIMGLPPGRSAAAPRLYVSGENAAKLMILDGHGPIVRNLGEDIGQASAMKMVYAALTKGTSALHAAVMLLAETLGLSEAFEQELKESQTDAWRRMERMIPRLPADSGRWIGEMHEIASTFANAGMSAEFHQGAAWMYQLLSETPLAAETRATIDPNRSVQATVKIYAESLAARKPAGGK